MDVRGGPFQCLPLTLSLLNCFISKVKECNINKNVVTLSIFPLQRDPTDSRALTPIALKQGPAVVREIRAVFYRMSRLRT